MTTTQSLDLETRLDTLSRQVQALVDDAQDRRRARDAYGDLIHDLGPIANQGMGTVTRVMGEAERRGYFGFAKSGMGVVDRVVTSFSEEDVAALGDNVVLILETVKEMTQPEVMRMMQSTLHSVGDLEDDIGDPPRLITLLGRLRDPDVRRGLHRLITALASMGQVSEDESKRKETRT